MGLDLQKVKQAIDTVRQKADWVRTKVIDPIGHVATIFPFIGNYANIAVAAADGLDQAIDDLDGFIDAAIPAPPAAPPAPVAIPLPATPAPSSAPNDGL